MKRLKKRIYKDVIYWYVLSNYGEVYQRQTLDDCMRAIVDICEWWKYEQEQ